MDIKQNKPSSRRGYSQGYYRLNNPEKYVGDPSKIIYRSSWEYRFIPYFNPIDQKEHKYFVDFYLRVDKKGKYQDFIAEVKPKASLLRPILENRHTVKKLKQYNDALKTWLVNRAKFAAANEYAKTRGYKFVVLTEEFLFENFKK